jgi:hypothetical protein
MVPSETVERLKELLRSCTALVSVDGRSRGTAFFISDRLLLTCQHVVKDNPEVDVEPFRRTARKAEVVGQVPEDNGDLALLKVALAEDEPPIPCVLLDERLDEADYYVAGYPREEGFAAGLEVYKVEGHSRSTNTGEWQLLQLEAGNQITWGMSGGPVFSTAAGAVTAVVRSAKDPMGALGGGAIPISKASEAFEEVRQAVKEAPLAVTQWRDTLGKELWQRLGRMWDRHAQVDLKLTGARNQWCITTEPDDASGTVNAAELGDDVTEAMFRWAQRRRISATEEVELLGRLLSRALFPKAVASRLQFLADAEEVLVRLHIQKDSKLDDIPWELAAVPGQQDGYEFLAADSRFRFVRVVDSATEASDPLETTPIQVLGVVALPQSWKFPTVYGETSYDWPPFEDIMNGFGEHFVDNGYSPQLLERPQWTDLLYKLESSKREMPPLDVLHYVGVGRIGKQGKAQLTFVNPEGDETWQDAESLLRNAAKYGVRIVVLELALPPADRYIEHITPSSLGTLLQGSINAVVFTRFPVHPRQFHSFNRVFYRHLERGDTVEMAVQLGRRELEQNKAIEDAAGFGWFTLVTGPKPGIRLVPQRAASPQQPTPKLVGGDEGREPGRPAPPPPVGSGDAFGRSGEERS